MSVHDKELYGEIKKALNIPPEEPIFILRGQDVSALPCLNFYFMNNAGKTGSQQWLDNLKKHAQEFQIFANNHPESMKEPD